MSINLQEIFESDQHDRQNPADWNDPQKVTAITQRDNERRVKALEAIQSGELTTPQDFYYAAMVFQHGESLDDFKTANNLAKQSMEMGYEPAKWLYAASLDRWLINQGLSQKFGTQYRILEDGSRQYFPIDPSTTDEERRAFNIPLLKE